MHEENQEIHTKLTGGGGGGGGEKENHIGYHSVTLTYFLTTYLPMKVTWWYSLPSTADDYSSRVWLYSCVTGFSFSYSKLFSWSRNSLSLWNLNTVFTQLPPLDHILSQFTYSQPISVKSILVLSYLHLSLPSSIFLYGFQTNILYELIVLCMCAT
jgi:hypothetical protein